MNSRASLSSDIYVYGPGSIPIEQISSGGTVTYLHHDQQGSTRLLTGSTGTVTGKCSYSPYGVATCEGSTTTPLGYDAQCTSTDTGLIYLRNRVYDPSTAQFLTVDPAVGVTRAPYNYGGDNPVNRRDPDGLSSEGIEGVPCYFPFCGPPPPAVEGVQHGVEESHTASKAHGTKSTKPKDPTTKAKPRYTKKKPSGSAENPIPETLKKWAIVKSSESSKRTAPTRTPIRPKRLEEKPGVTTITRTRPRVKSISRQRAAVSQFQRGWADER
jgi:RHS repeat-associated protein